MIRDMLRLIRSKLAAPWTDERENGDSSEETFRRSELDASVPYAHGADVNRLENEITDIEEQAQALEEARRYE
jgi:hypothetical protein